MLYPLDTNIQIDYYLGFSRNNAVFYRNSDIAEAQLCSSVLYEENIWSTVHLQSPHQHKWKWSVSLLSLKKLSAAQSIVSGILYLFNPHTTAGLTINEGADPDVCRDIIMGLAPYSSG